jgi:hypothetical protein
MFPGNPPQAMSFIESQAIFKSLVNEKYAQEYKLDRKTKSKAEEILTEYFKNYPMQHKVTYFFQLLSLCGSCCVMLFLTNFAGGNCQRRQP